MGNNEKLNIKTSLREDGVIFKNLRASDYDNLGRYYNIKTVEQFINHDFHEDGLTSVTICKYEAVQNALKYSYLGLPLEHGELLDKKYSDYELNYREGKELFREIRYDLITLGFTGNRTSDDIRSYIEKKYRQEASEDTVEKTANMGYYGVNSAQEAAGAVGYYAETNLGAVNPGDNPQHEFEFEAAYGMKKQ